MALGYFALVLHAHLPFVRHPENARHLEERWFFEGLIECYLPLLEAFDALAADGVPFAVTMSVTPPLAAMMRDELLVARFVDHLDRLERLAAKEAIRLHDDERFGPVARFYVSELARMRGVLERHDRDVLGGFVAHWDAGRIELLTCSATHCYLPGLLPCPEGIRPQLELGVRGFERIVGRRPTGAWLAECAYHPSFDQAIRDAGIELTLVDTHGIGNATPRPPLGVHAPIVSPAGVSFFGRDAESSRQVWSRDEGYPGDAYYRDFYRDIGFDLPENELMGEIGDDGARLMTGLKYYRITGKDIDKEAYQPGVARQKATEHAANFVANRVAQIRHLAGAMEATPIVVSPYDAELYGHWWFEGPMFLEALFRQLPAAGGEVEAITLKAYLDRHPVTVQATPSASSWGAGGYGEVWVGPEAAWSWRHVHHATRYTTLLVANYRGEVGLRGRALDQAIRELLLLQSSDWNFILKTGTQMGYAEARIRAHTRRLRHLGHLLESGEIAGDDAAWLEDVCARDNFLAQMEGDELRGVFAGKRT